jgi:hypothetical protein
MVRKVVGGGLDMAEIIIDYKNKSVKMLDPTTRKEPRETNYPGIFTFFMAGLVYIFLLIFNWVPYVFRSSFFMALLNWFLIACLIYGMTFVAGPMSGYYHYCMQWLQYEFLATANVVYVDKLNSKVYQLPYMFGNRKLNYKCYGDFKTYLIKVHIEPKNYYWKDGNRIVKQTEEWDAFFYFTKIPRKGRMEIEFI